MLNGLTHEGIAELRRRYPRLLLPELIGRMAAFPNVCFAGAKYLGEQIGRSARTVFRYLAIMREDGILGAVWGPRDPKQMHPDIEEPGPMKQHGYKMRGFTGWLGPFVQAHRATVATRWEAKQARAAERRRKQQAARRKRDAERHAEIQAEKAKLEQDFAILGERAKQREQGAQKPRTWTPTHRDRPRHVGSAFDQALEPSRRNGGTGPPE